MMIATAATSVSLKARATPIRTTGTDECRPMLARRAPLASVLDANHEPRTPFQAKFRH